MLKDYLPRSALSRKLFNSGWWARALPSHVTVPKPYRIEIVARLHYLSDFGTNPRERLNSTLGVGRSAFGVSRLQREANIERPTPNIHSRTQKRMSG
jgi:hypothetical protein